MNKKHSNQIDQSIIIGYHIIVSNKANNYIQLATILCPGPDLTVLSFDIAMLVAACQHVFVCKIRLSKEELHTTKHQLSNKQYI